MSRVVGFTHQAAIVSAFHALDRSGDTRIGIALSELAHPSSMILILVFRMPLSALGSQVSRGLIEFPGFRELV